MLPLSKKAHVRLMDQPKCHFNTFCNFENWEEVFGSISKLSETLSLSSKRSAFKKKPSLIEETLYNKDAVSS